MYWKVGGLNLGPCGAKNRAQHVPIICDVCEKAAKFWIVCCRVNFWENIFKYLATRRPGHPGPLFSEEHKRKEGKGHRCDRWSKLVLWNRSRCLNMVFSHTQLAPFPVCRVPEKRPICFHHIPHIVPLQGRIRIVKWFKDCDINAFLLVNRDLR